jgi:hypothetical protein
MDSESFIKQNNYAKEKKQFPVPGICCRNGNTKNKEDHSASGGESILTCSMDPQIKEDKP